MIKVTDSETFATHLLNADHIVAVEKANDGSKIVMDNRMYFVTENLEAVDDKIDNDYYHRARYACHHCLD